MAAGIIDYEILEILKALNSLGWHQSKKHHHRDVEVLRRRVEGKISHPIDNILIAMERKGYIPNHRRPELTQMGFLTWIKHAKAEANNKGYRIL